MYSSDTEPSGKAARTALAYLLISVLCALFGAVYEVFSHGVYSFYMLYAFGFPLLGGALPFLMLCTFGRGVYPGSVPRNLYHSGIATLTAGSIVRGILDIYGTTNRLAQVYWYVGGALLLGGVVAFVGQRMQKTE